MLEREIIIIFIFYVEEKKKIIQFLNGKGEVCIHLRIMQKMPNELPVAANLNTQSTGLAKNVDASINEYYLFSIVDELMCTEEEINRPNSVSQKQGC